MDIYATNGDRVCYANFLAGGDDDYVKCEKYLTRGGVYTVDKTVVHNYYTTVYLLEFPDISFNSVMFEDHHEN
jgi:hypothetical protein